MEIKSELGYEPFLEFLFGAEESSEDIEEAQEELDSGCDYIAEGSICIDDNSEGTGQSDEHTIEFIGNFDGKAHLTKTALLAIYTRNKEELFPQPNKTCYCSINKAGKKAAQTSKKAKKTFALLTDKPNLRLSNS